MPISIRRWHFFAISSFAGRCEHSFPLPIVQKSRLFSSYTGLSGRSSISGLAPSRVSRIIFSFVNSASLYCTLHFSQRRGGSGVGLSQKESIPSGVRLFAGCAMLYFIKNSIVSREAGALTTFQNVIRGAKSRLNYSTLTCGASLQRKRIN